VLGTAGLRDRFESAGASFRVYRYAPDDDCRSAETDLIKEWEARTPLGQFARVRDRVMFGPARASSSTNSSAQPLSHPDSRDPSRR
jgi:hypothetical protein